MISNRAATVRLVIISDYFRSSIQRRAELNKEHEPCPSMESQAIHVTTARQAGITFCDEQDRLPERGTIRE